MFSLKLIPVAVGLSLLSATPAIAGSVTVNVKGIKQAKGDLYIGLQTRDQFLKDAGSYGTIVRAPKTGDQSIDIKDVAAGDYSISVWHDSDGDGKFSRAENGMPLDGWSMVGGETLRAAPEWDKVKTSIDANRVVVSLTMIYSQ